MSLSSGLTKTVKQAADTLLYKDHTFYHENAGPPELVWDTKPQTNTFSFADADVNLILPWYKSEIGVDSHIIPLKTIKLVSVSQHRDHYPVTGMGQRPIRGFTKGQRMTAGSLGFNTFGESAFSEALRKYHIWRGLKGSESILATPDELPPMDLLITMVNEHKSTSALWIKSFVIVDSSRTITENNPQLDEVYSFMAAQASTWYYPGLI